MLLCVSWLEAMGIDVTSGCYGFNDNVYSFIYFYDSLDINWNFYFWECISNVMNDELGR